MQTRTEVYNIYYDNDSEIVTMEWFGYATTQQFREGTEIMLNTMLKHQATKVLADIREMVIIGMDDQKWLENEFVPRAIEFGFRHMAIIRPKHYFNKVAVESVSYKIDRSKLAISFFDNREEASAWLANV